MCQTLAWPYYFTKRDFWAQFNPATFFFTEVPVPRLESEQSFTLVLGYQFCLFLQFVLNFRNVSTLWYCLFFITFGCKSLTHVQYALFFFLKHTYHQMYTINIKYELTYCIQWHLFTQSEMSNVMHNRSLHVQKVKGCWLSKISCR
jgi:hypothetical protein